MSTITEPAVPAAVWDSAAARIEVLGRLGRGGQGRVHATADGRAVKFLGSVDADGLHARLAIPADRFLDQRTGHRWAVWPESAVSASAADGELLGYVMAAAGGQPLLAYLGPAARLSARVECSPRFIVRTAVHLAAACWWCDEIAAVTAIDLHPGNVVVNSLTARVTLLDADGMSIDGTARLVLPDVAPPEQLLSQPMSATASGRWALAIVVVQLLLDGADPFGGVPHDDDAPGWTSATNIKVGWSWVLDPAGGSGPISVDARTLLGPELMALVEQAFGAGRDDPSVRPSARDWALALDAYDRSLVSCKGPGRHVHRGALDRCPWCAAMSGGTP